MKMIGRILIVTLGLASLTVCLLPAAVIHLLKWHIFPPEKLTPMVVEWVNRNIDGNFECEKIDFTLLETFPRLGIRLDNGRLTVAREVWTEDSVRVQLTDTLASFTKARVAFNVRSYLDREVIDIERVFLENPSVFARVEENGKANWEIWESADPPEEPEGIEDTLNVFPKINLQSVRIAGADVLYEDGRTGDFFEAEGMKFSFKNIGKETGRRFEIKFDTPALAFQTEAYGMARPTAVKVAADIEFLREDRTLVVEFAEAEVAGIPLQVKGKIGKTEEGADVDIEYRMAIFDLNTVVDYIPKEYFVSRRKTEVGGTLKVGGWLSGSYNENSYPDLFVRLQVTDGVLKNKSTGKGIRRLDIEAEGTIMANTPYLSTVKLDRFILEGPNTAVDLKGSVKNFDSPSIVAELKGNADLTGLTEEIFHPDSLTVRGSVSTDLRAVFRLDDLMEGRTDRIEASGVCRIPELRVRHREAGINLFLRQGSIEIDSARLDSRFIEGEDLIRATAHADTVFLRMADRMYTRIGGLDIQAKTTRILDTASIVPVTAAITVNSFRSRTPDSLWVMARNVDIRGGIKSSTTDKKKPVVAARLSLDTLRYLDVPEKTFGVMSGGVFDIEALPRAELRARQAARAPADTTERRRPAGVRDRTRQGAAPQTASATGSDPSVRFLRNWEVRGSVRFEQTRAFSAMFPLPMRMENTTVRFDTDKITLTDAKFYAGKSDLRLDGELNSLRRAYMAGGKIRGNLSVAGRYLDCNELMAAMEKGLQYMDGAQPDAVDLTDGEDLASLEQAVLAADAVPTEEPEGIFVVPDNLDLALDLNIDRADFRELSLHQVHGEMVVRNQSVNLSSLSMQSEVGSGHLTMVYTAKDKTGASTGIDIEIEKMIVEKFIEMFPSIDSLLPMLRSFEGVLDCQISATCELDSAVNVIFPSIHSACFLKGENMVLLDGETFAEISKTLMFKNKEKNLIENISVDLFINDNKIEIYPFLVEMDRYRLAVGGVHGLDMNFDYHVSVLKSPVPFKLGIDITGNLDDFKYKVVKCKYKDIFKPAREKELEETRINLRAGIRESIRNSFRINAPEMEREIRFRDLAESPERIRRIYHRDDDDPDEEAGEIPEESGGEGEPGEDADPPAA